MPGSPGCPLGPGSLPPAPVTPQRQAGEARCPLRPPSGGRAGRGRLGEGPVQQARLGRCGWRSAPRGPAWPVLSAEASLLCGRGGQARPGLGAWRGGLPTPEGGLGRPGSWALIPLAPKSGPPRPCPLWDTLGSQRPVWGTWAVGGSSGPHRTAGPRGTGDTAHLSPSPASGLPGARLRSGLCTHSQVPAYWDQGTPRGGGGACAEAGGRPVSVGRGVGVVPLAVSGCQGPGGPGPGLGGPCLGLGAACWGFPASWRASVSKTLGQGFGEDGEGGRGAWPRGRTADPSGAAPGRLGSGLEGQGTGSSRACGLAHPQHMVSPTEAAIPP